MNELAIRVALKNLIQVNETLLVQDLDFQEQPRVIHQVTYSTLTSPSGYYFVQVSVNTEEASVRQGFGRTTTNSPSQAEYQCIIEVADYAVGSVGEDQMYEKMDADFMRFTDRIVSKLRESYRVVDTPDLKVRLPDEKIVTKSNLSDIWSDNAGYHAMLYARITFTLLEECTDDASLYN